MELIFQGKEAETQLNYDNGYDIRRPPATLLKVLNKFTIIHIQTNTNLTFSLDQFCAVILRYDFT